MSTGFKKNDPVRVLTLMLGLVNFVPFCEVGEVVLILSYILAMTEKPKAKSGRESTRPRERKGTRRVE